MNQTEFKLHSLGGPKLMNVEVIANTLISLRDKYSANQIIVFSKLPITKGFQSSLNSKFTSAVPQYLGRDEIVKLIDDVLPDFWRHEDLTLLKYEKDLLDYLDQDNDLKRLKFPKENYGKLLNIFVEPRLVRYSSSTASCFTKILVKPIANTYIS